MRRSLLGVLAGAVLVVSLAAGRGSSEPAAVGAGASFTPTGALISHVTAGDGGTQVVTIIDPNQRAMAIYHVDRATGEITLKSARNFTWDLQMLEYNSGKPLPQEIRDMRGELQR